MIEEINPAVQTAIDGLLEQYAIDEEQRNKRFDMMMQARRAESDALIADMKAAIAQIGRGGGARN